jgi:hypothetical protein
MGQYYKVILLAENNLDIYEIIRCFIEPTYNNGSKLMEHSYIDNDFVAIVESLLSPEGMFYKSRIVWAGDYADNEPNLNDNLYTITETQNNKAILSAAKISKDYIYILNHTKKLYIDKTKYDNIHPLPILTAEGNGRGGGDYYGTNIELVGTWARDVISVEKHKPDNYTKFTHKFE